jgi:hypothetical protein
VRLGQGRENVKTFLGDNPDLFEEIRTAVLAKRLATDEDESPDQKSAGKSVAGTSADGASDAKAAGTGAAKGKGGASKAKGAQRKAS